MNEVIMTHENIPPLEKFSLVEQLISIHYQLSILHKVAQEEHKQKVKEAYTLLESKINYIKNFL